MARQQGRRLSKAGVWEYNDVLVGAAAPGVYGESAHWQGVAGVSRSAGADAATRWIVGKAAHGSDRLASVDP
jgi:hypothetical protein